MDSGGLVEKGWKSPIESPVRGTKRVYPACHSCHFPLASRKNYPKEGGWMSGRRVAVGVRAWNRARVSRLPLVVETAYMMPAAHCLYAHQTHVATSELYHDWDGEVHRGPSTSNRHFPSPLAPRNLATTFASRWRFLHFPTVCRHG